MKFCINCFELLALLGINYVSFSEFRVKTKKIQVVFKNFKIFYILFGIFIFVLNPPKIFHEKHGFGVFNDFWGAFLHCNFKNMYLFQIKDS